MPDSELPNSLDYSRRLYDTVVKWYENADAKAQIILSLDGAFLTFLMTSIFIDPGELSRITQKFTTLTRVSLALMCCCLVGSIVSALMCLWSRMFLSGRRDHVLVIEKERISDSTRYSPNVMLFFRTIGWLDHDKFQAEMCLVDEDFEIKALASQIYLLSRRVYIKHLWVNAGFVLAGASLICLLAGGISYLANL